MMLLFLLLLPLVFAAAALFFRDLRSLGRMNAAVHGALLLGVLPYALGLAAGRPLSFAHFFFADALSGFFMLTIAVVNAAAALYSAGYIEGERRAGALTPQQARRYFVLFNLFTFSMYLVTVLDNLGFVWVAIEMTTLVSAFLVGFYNDKKSVEAAWKYLILCSVGITLALLGTILFYYTLSVHAGVQSLNWTDMMAAAPSLDRNVLKIAFVFILVGYGTKAGLAPMHTWLPDAHSQAPAPISALLSGVLLKTSLYAIMRFSTVVNRAYAAPFTGSYLVIFGLASLALAAGFILVQKDIKRLLAYSSIEHVGVIALGLGIGGPLGFFGALFHVFNHAVTKSLMFFGAGEMVRRYGTHNMNLMRGAARALPGIGILTLLGAFALAGTPPFSVFFSELKILMAAFAAGRYAVGGAFLLCIAVAFGGIIYHFSRIVFGKVPEEMAPYTPPAGEKAAFVFLALFIAVMGVALPGPFKALLLSAARILQ